MSRRTERIGLQKIAGGTDRNLWKLPLEERRAIRRYAREVLKEMDKHPQLNLTEAAIITNQHEARCKKKRCRIWDRYPKPKSK